MRRLVLILAGLSLAIIDSASAQTAGAPVVVTVTNKGCEPNELTVPAGTVTFQIVNKGSRALEWEILKGVMVVDERENIAPGFRQKLTTKLEPGDYEITCGLLSNPRGKLFVRGIDGATVAASKPSPMELIGPVAEYRVWLAGQLSALQAKTDALVAATAAGNIEAAKVAWSESRVIYLRLAPVFPMLADASAMASTGFDRVEDALFTDTPKPEALAAELAGFQKAMTAFQLRARALVPTPGGLVSGAELAAKALISALRAMDVAPERSAISNAEARLSGIARVVELFGPLALRSDKAVGARISATLASATAAVAAKTASAGMTSDDHARLVADTAPLPAELAALSAVLGL